MTTRIDKLVARGFVRREPCGTDRRSLKVVLSARGCSLVDSIVGARMEDATECLASVTKAQRAELARLLRLVNQGLEALDDPE